MWSRSEVGLYTCDYAAKLAEKERGMAEMSAKFRDMGGEVYVEGNASEKA